MSIFGLLKTSINRETLTILNEYLKFSARQEETEVELNLFNDCMQSCRYPKHFWKEIRRCGFYPNAKSLKRHTLNYVDTKRVKLSELQRFVSQWIPAVSSLPEELRTPYEEYVKLVQLKAGARKEKKLLSSLNNQVPQLTFPVNPERYVFNLSSVNLSQTQLNVLSLGPKFCIPCKKTD